MTHKNCGGNVIETKINDSQDLTKYCTLCFTEDISIEDIE